MAPTGDLAARVQLLDWRRCVAELYAAVRADPDPEHAWNVWRQTRERLFLDHAQSPLPSGRRAAEHAPAYYAYDPSYRVVAMVHDTAAGAVTVPASAGEGYRLVNAGTASLSLAGTDLALRLLWFDDYAGGLLLTCRDGTSGTETYGGGRYLLDTAKSADLGEATGGLVVDFNFAYQPSCSYDARWNCPLAPRENWVNVPIRAGERLRDGD